MNYLKLIPLSLYQLKINVFQNNILDFMSMFALVNDSQYVQYQYIKIVLDTSGCEEDA